MPLHAPLQHTSFFTTEVAEELADHLIAHAPAGMSHVYLVSGGSEDPPSRWIPLNHTVAVNKLLGYEHRVGMTNRKTHDPTEESNERLYEFFQHFLKAK